MGGEVWCLVTFHCLLDNVASILVQVPGTLGEQWAYDPHATYKDAPTVIRTLIPVVAKGGNWLLNIGPDSTGQVGCTAANIRW